MSDMKEYVVTVRNRSDIDSFYDDMESVGGDLHIPNRRVEITALREISRSTDYLLTDQEAELLRKDPRILDVLLKESIKTAKPSFTQTGNFDKSSVNNNTHINWALLRCEEGVQRSNWGGSGWSGNQIIGNTNESATISVTGQGAHVDVVIVDGHLNPNHPEFAVNADGTGGSRVIQYNWFQHNPSVTFGSVGNYLYTVGVSGTQLSNDNHGMHVAGTVAGNTQGWARKANIYNINPYGTNPNGNIISYILDYIRQFHLNKSINPVTGRKNPTIVNNSWAFIGDSYLPNQISSVTYRGTTYNGPFNLSTLKNSYGILNDGTYAYTPGVIYSFINAEIEDAIDDGIIIVAAAGNEYYKVDAYGGSDYNNFMTANGFIEYYHRGSHPGSAYRSDNTRTTITVGALDATVNEYKTEFSNCGARIDVYAPGAFIMSSVHTGGTTDSRNNVYRLEKYSGTSMASPQVTGVLACALEKFPNMSNDEALNYLSAYSKLNQVADTGGGYGDYRSLQGSTNRYLFFKKERPLLGDISLNTFKTRQSTGAAYPRTRIRRFG